MRSGERRLIPPLAPRLLLLVLLAVPVAAWAEPAVPLPPLPEAQVTRSGKAGDGGGVRRLACVRRGDPALVYCRTSLESAQGVEIASAPLGLKLAKSWLSEALRELARTPPRPPSSDAAPGKVTWSLRFDPLPAHQGQADLPELAPEPLLRLESRLLGRIDDELAKAKTPR